MPELFQNQILLIFGVSILMVSVAVVLLMPVTYNEETVEKNLISLHWSFLWVFCAIQLILSHFLFSTKPELFTIFIKSLFILLSSDEASKLKELNANSFLLIGSSFCAIFLTYFAVKSFEDLLKAYSLFLTKRAESRIAIIKHYLKGITIKTVTNGLSLVGTIAFVSGIRWLYFHCVH